MSGERPLRETARRLMPGRMRLCDVGRRWARVVLLALVCAAGGADSFDLQATFTEEMITIRWLPQPGIKAYNVYASVNGEPARKVNPIPVATRTQFSFIWLGNGDDKYKAVKGNHVALHVRALAGERCTRDEAYCREEQSSTVLATDYFGRYGRILKSDQAGKLLTKQQTLPLLVGDSISVSRAVFLRHYPVLARRIDSLYRSTINPRDEGACVPISTMAAKYFNSAGIPCLRCQGTFISQFHSFNMVIVDGVEYIIDFTADQFLPSSAPVLIPREYCHIDSSGAPTSTPGEISTAMYLIDKIYHADQVQFSETVQAQGYRQMLEELLKK